MPTEGTADATLRCVTHNVSMTTEVERKLLDRKPLFGSWGGAVASYINQVEQQGLGDPLTPRLRNEIIGEINAAVTTAEGRLRTELDREVRRDMTVIQQALRRAVRLLSPTARG